jgi:hypothetical protein
VDWGEFGFVDWGELWNGDRLGELDIILILYDVMGDHVPLVSLDTVFKWRERRFKTIFIARR